MGRRKSLPPNFMTAKMMKDHFRKCDRNGDGKLNLRELVTAFRGLGAIAPHWQAFCAILRADENGDGCISEHELNQLVDYAFEKGFILPNK